MKHKDVAIEVVAVRRRRPEENRFLSQKSCSGVFHSAIGKTGNEHHVILGKRERLGEEAGKIIDSLGRDLLHFRRLLFRLLEFGLPDIQSRQARCFMHFAKRPRSKGKQIRADGACFGKNGKAPAGTSLGLRFDRRIGNGRPIFRRGQFEPKAAFQIGLVKTGKGHLGVHGDKQSVDVLGAVVFVFKASDGSPRRRDRRGEIHVESIFTPMNGVCRQLDVAVVDLCRNRRAIDGQVGDASFAEVDQNHLGRTGTKLKVLMTGCGGSVRDKREAEIIAQV